MNEMSSILRVKCPVEVCNLQFAGGISLLYHIRHNHYTNEYNSGLICLTEDCLIHSSSYHAFRMHLKRYHPAFANISDPIPHNRSNIIADPNQDFHTNLTPHMFNYNLDSNPTALTNKYFPSTVSSNKQRTLSFEEKFFEFCLRTREKHVLPISVYKSIVDDALELFKFYEQMLSEKLNQYNIDQSQLNFPDVDTIWVKYSSDTFFRQTCEKIGYFEPVKIICSDGNEIGRYLSILKTLTYYLSHQEVLDSIKTKLTCDMQDRENLLSCYVDGDHFKNHSCFQGQLNVLRVHLFVDEFECCVAIGAAKGIHKVVGVYFFLGNLEQKYLANLRNFFLIAIATSDNVKKHGYGVFLRPLLEDLSHLEYNGISVTVNGETLQFYGGMATISGDNLGLNDIGGFRKCFSSGKFCRFCMVDYKEFKSGNYNCDASLVPRKERSHISQVQSVMRDPDLQKEFGVRNACCFQILSYFEATTFLPCDIMHDLLCNGVIRVIVTVILTNLHQDKLVSNDQFKCLLEKYDMPYSDKRNKPSSWIRQYKGASTGSLTAAQGWCLFRHLPFILGPYVPKDYLIWKLYYSLSSICEIVFSPVIPIEKLAYLDSLCHDFFYSCIYEFKISNVMIPKFHFILHYARLIKLYGPLRHLWTFRFESFHQKLKKIIVRSHNRKNVCYTIAKRLSYEKTWHQFPYFTLADSAVRFSRINRLDLKLLENHLLRNALVMKHIINSDVTSICVTGKLLLNCKTYVKGEVHVIDIVNELYVFFQIKHIIFVNSKWYLGGILLDINHFDPHFFSYNVTQRNCYLIVKPGDELSIHPLNIAFLKLCNCNYSCNMHVVSFIRMRYLVFRK